jgi:hypothetical protein
MDKAEYGGGIYSTDAKADMLSKDYGKDIYSLTKENSAAIAEDKILFEFQKLIIENVQL